MRLAIIAAEMECLVRRVNNRRGSAEWGKLIDSTIQIFDAP